MTIPEGVQLENSKEVLRSFFNDSKKKFGVSTFESFSCERCFWKWEEVKTQKKENKLFSVWLLLELLCEAFYRKNITAHGNTLETNFRCLSWQSTFILLWNTWSLNWRRLHNWLRLTDRKWRSVRRLRCQCVLLERCANSIVICAHVLVVWSQWSWWVRGSCTATDRVTLLPVKFRAS